MNWLLAVALAGAAFALAALVLRIGRAQWATFGAALMLGLAGYALQASPGVPGSPAPGLAARPQPGPQWRADRQEMVAFEGRSHNNRLLIADAYAARGQYITAAALLRGVVREAPRDGEAWLALANALVEHADGALTPPALFAYGRARALPASALGAGYFLGLNQIRGGDIMAGRQTWADTLAAVPALTPGQTAGRAREGARGRALLEERLGRLDVLLRQALEASQAR